MEAASVFTSLLSPAAPLCLPAPSLPQLLPPRTCGGRQGPEWEAGGQAVAVVFLPAHMGVREDREARACIVLPDEDILICCWGAALGDHHIHLGSCTKRESGSGLLHLREEGAGDLDSWVQVLGGGGWVFRLLGLREERWGEWGAGFLNLREEGQGSELQRPSRRVCKVVWGEGLER